MGKTGKILSQFIQIISPIPLLAFTIYMIVVSSNGLWIRSNGPSILVVSIIVALATIFSLSVVIISILTSKQNENSNIKKIFQFSIFLTGICVFIATIYSSYKKELEARFLTSEYLNAINSSSEAESFNSSYPTNTDKDSFYHNRTLFIHDVIILLYALELLLYFISEKYANDIISFFKENDFTEEVDIENAPAKQKSIINPLEVDQESKSEEDKRNKENMDEKQEQNDNKQQQNAQNDNAEKAKDIPLIIAKDNEKENEQLKDNEKERNIEDKQDKKQDDTILQKKEDSPEKGNNENDKQDNNKKEQPQIDSTKKGGLSKTDNPKKKTFSLFSDSDSLQDDFDLFISRPEPRKSPTRGNKSSTTSPGSIRKRGRNYEQKSSDDSFEIPMRTSPTQRRTRRITMDNKQKTSPFGFSFESNGTSTESLLNNNNNYSRTSPVNIDLSNRPSTARRTRTSTTKSPFGFDLTQSESSDDIFKDL